MADISGRRDRNKKSPGVHYDMHRCVRAAVICTVSLQNAQRGYATANATRRKGRRRGEGRREGGTHLHACIPVCNVFRIVSNDAGGIEEQRYRGTSIHGKDFGSGCCSKNWRFVLRFERERERGLFKKIEKEMNTFINFCAHYIGICRFKTHRCPCNSRDLSLYLSKHTMHSKSWENALIHPNIIAIGIIYSTSVSNSVFEWSFDRSESD